jgi:hypothetical protein
LLKNTDTKKSWKNNRHRKQTAAVKNLKPDGSKKKTGAIAKNGHGSQKMKSPTRQPKYLFLMNVSHSTGRRPIHCQKKLLVLLFISPLSFMLFVINSAASSLSYLLSAS